MPQIDNTPPYEVIAGPLEIWLGPLGTAFPEDFADPDGEWTRVGLNGARNYDEEGVSVSHAQTIAEWYSLGGTGAIKAFRGRESQSFSVKVADLSLETYSLALNGNPATEDGGVRRIGLSRGSAVTEYAAIIRGNSPYGNGLKRQYNLPRVYHSGSPEVVSTKDTPCLLDLTLTSLEDLNAVSDDLRFGELLAEDGDT